MKLTYLLRPIVPLALSVGAMMPVSATPPSVHVVKVTSLGDAPDLVCPVRPGKPKKPRPPTPTDEPALPLGIPEPQEVQEALADTHAPDGVQPIAVPKVSTMAPAWQAVEMNQTFRVAFWGDSHLAAGFFTQELAKRAGVTTDQLHSAFIAATLTRPGVRLPVRKACASTDWRHESAHAVSAAAKTPGPALVSQISTTANASLAWDLRNPQRIPVHRSLQLMFEQTAAPIRIGLRVDGGTEQQLTLAASPGPAVLELQGDSPLSTLQLRLIEGGLRHHGLALPVPPTARLQLDLFAMPGATARAWQNANLDYLQSWFTDSPSYQLVVLAYGTNEGNEKPFDASAYHQMLRQSVSQLKQMFPNSACLLIGPGDRGILVPRQRLAKSSNKKSAKQPGGRGAANKQPVPRPDLLKYSNIHTEITRIQQSIGAELGCQTWSMMRSMGGKASAYSWVRQRPQLMANDLIHFTLPGYQRLAQGFAEDMGWTTKTLWQMP
jgi:lysophospholipase L1-like esterase